MAFFRFQDLRVYKKILEFAQLADAHTPPASGLDGRELNGRLTEAALTAAMKIAEGASMPREIFIDRLRQTKTLIRECVVLIDYALIMEYLKEDKYALLMNELEKITRMIGALISSLVRNNTPTHTEIHEDKDWENCEKFNNYKKLRKLWQYSNPLKAYDHLKK